MLTSPERVDDLLRLHPGTAYLPRASSGLQWYKGAENWDYVAGEQTVNVYRRDHRNSRPPRLPRPTAFSIIARISHKGFQLLPDAVNPTVHEGCNARFAGGSAIVEDPEWGLEGTEFKRGWTNLMRIASIPLPMSMDVVHTEGLFRMVGNEPGIELIHTFFAARRVLLLGDSDL